jgi:hypothetical protein
MSRHPPDVDALRTRLARKFSTLADEVNESFEGFHIGGGDYVVELLAPEGQSTGGGKQALQHLRLRPRRSGHGVIVAGSVNAMEKTAELRTYEHVCLVHERRFKAPPDIVAEEWEQLLRKAETVLDLAKIRSCRVGPPPALVTPHATPRTSRLGLVLLVVLMALAASVAFRIATG